MSARIPLVPPRLRWGGVAVVAGAILVASVVDPPSSGPTPGGPLGIVGLDKYVHFAAYAGLGVAVAYALGDRPRLWVAAVALLAAAGFGLGIEFLQAPLPYRSFDLVDALANLTGAALAAVGWATVRGRIRYRTVDPTSDPTGGSR